MRWYDWMIIIGIVLAVAIAAFALYRSYNLSASDFADVTVA